LALAAFAKADEREQSANGARTFRAELFLRLRSPIQRAFLARRADLARLDKETRMGRLVLQMMISVDGMVSGPKGELDWIAQDEALNQDHLARLEQADAVVIGTGSYPGMADYWEAAADDEKAKPLMRAIGRAMTQTPRIVYSHRHVPVKPGDSLRFIENDKAFAADVERLKRETDGTLVSYGGVRLARSLVQLGLLDEIHLDICPVILGDGKALFTDLADRTKLRLLDSVTYESGAEMVHYEAIKAA
jgi:dihydrofolate reductase